MNYLELAADGALNDLENKNGGPFGAVIVKDGIVISTGKNMVIKEKDPTAHAEVIAIREACKKLGTHNLEGCIIYSTSEPCPMCLSAIIWANIKEIYYGTDRKAVSKIGFRDDYIYEYLKEEDGSIKKIKLDSEKCEELLRKYDDLIY